MRKLDLVYTYVNNSDYKWIEKIKEYKKNYRGGYKHLYNFKGEIFFSLLTVQKYFKWVNNIYIVHDNQKFDVSFLKIKDKIKFIDLKEIIPDKYLPCFNSNVIEMYLWKIKNLEEDFVYMNDDMFFGNYVEYSDFFDSNDNLKIFGLNIKYPKNSNTFVMSYRRTSEIFNEKYNTNIYILPIHLSWNLKKSCCERAFNEFNEYVTNLSIHKFRTYDSSDVNYKDCKYIDFLILSQTFQYYTGSQTKLIYGLFLPNDNFILLKLLYILKPKVCCINDYTNDKTIDNLKNYYLHDTNILTGLAKYIFMFIFYFCYLLTYLLFKFNVNLFF